MSACIRCCSTNLFPWINSPKYPELLLDGPPGRIPQKIISTNFDFSVAFWMYFDDLRKVTAKINSSVSCVEIKTSGVYMLTKLRMLPIHSTRYSGRWLNSLEGESGSGKLRT
jgi:hypothetical protein